RGGAGGGAPERARAYGALGRDQAESRGRPHVKTAPLAALALALAVGGCSESGLSPSAERGRQVYLAHCIACHNTDPAQAGAVGPPLRGSSRGLVEAQGGDGTHPPRLPPERPTEGIGPDIGADPRGA